MRLTPQQREQIELEKALSPGKSSFLIAPTPQQDEELKRELELEEAGQAATIARCRHLEELLVEDSLLGAIRRAIDDSDVSREQIAARSLVDPDRLKRFFWGDDELRSEELDRLARALGLRIVPV
jgi:ribosome-binding protein aMBF1 (putative translation factor)